MNGADSRANELPAPSHHSRIQEQQMSAESTHR